MKLYFYDLHNSDFNSYLSLLQSSVLVIDIKTHKLSIIKNMYGKQYDYIDFDIFKNEIEKVLSLDLDFLLIDEKNVNDNFAYNKSAKTYGSYKNGEWFNCNNGTTVYITKEAFIQELFSNLLSYAYAGGLKHENSENTGQKLDDPELAKEYENSKMWCIAYDNGFKHIEIVDDVVCLTKKEAENIAKDICDSELWKGTELTVVGIPVNNIEYGDTFYSPVENELEDGVIEIEDSLFFDLAKEAHKNNMTVTDYANKLLTDYIEKTEKLYNLPQDNDYELDGDGDE